MTNVGRSDEADSRTQTQPDVKALVHQRVLSDVAELDGLGQTEMRARIEGYVADADPLIGIEERSNTTDEIVDEVFGLGAIEPLMRDSSVTEIMLNGPGLHRSFVERFGIVEPVSIELDAGAIERIAQRIIAPLGLRLDRSAPIVDARLANGARLQAVLPPLAPDGPIVTIRKFAPRVIDLFEFGLGASAVARLSSALRGGRNVLIAGATSTGKTTFLNALCNCLDERERIVTIEETAELRLAQPHVVRLEGRPANAEGAGAATIRDLLRASLRMRPDRLIIGEVRGGEAVDLLQAMNTGHRGSLSTIHANSATDALSRLETLALIGAPGMPLPAIRSQIASAIDIVVHIERTIEGRRRVREIIDVDQAANCWADDSGITLHAWAIEGELT